MSVIFIILIALALGLGYVFRNNSTPMRHLVSEPPAPPPAKPEIHDPAL